MVKERITKMKILVINAGSSSLKYQLIDMQTEQVLAKGLCERIGIGGHLKHSPLFGDKPVFDEESDRTLMDMLTGSQSMNPEELIMLRRIYEIRFDLLILYLVQE